MKQLRETNAVAIENEYLKNLSREQVQAHLIPIPKQESYSSIIATDLSKTVIGQDAAMEAIAGRVALADSQMNDPNRPLSIMFFAGPTGCLHKKTPIYDPVDQTTLTVGERYKKGNPFHVYALDDVGKIVITEAGAPLKFTKEKMYRVTFDDGSSISVTDAHRFYVGNSYSELSKLRYLLTSSVVLLPSISDNDLSKLSVDDLYSWQKAVDFQDGYHLLFYLYDRLLRKAKDTGQAFSPSQVDAHAFCQHDSCRDAEAHILGYNRHYHKLFHHSKPNFFFRWNKISLDVFRHLARSVNFLISFLKYGTALQFVTGYDLNDITLQPSQALSRPSYSYIGSQSDDITGIGRKQIIKIEPIGKRIYYDFHVPYFHNYWAVGVFHHNTGKTESAHALADVLFHDPNSNQLRIVDCAEFSQSHMISRLTGAPPSYVGYGEKPQIDAEFLSRRNIVVFDEIEKAHPSFHRLLLGVMESGRLAIRNGTELSFANTHMILTSNIGAKDMQKARKGKSSIGFTPKNETVDLDAIGKKALIEHFSDIPEFLGRIDEIVVFNELAPEHYEAIFWKFLHRKNAQIKERMKKNAPYLSATQEAKDYFLGKIDKQFGARDLRGLMDREIFQQMADLFMQIDLTGKPIIIDVEDGESVFYTDDSAEQELLGSVTLFESNNQEVTV